MNSKKDKQIERIIKYFELGRINKEEMMTMIEPYMQGRPVPLVYMRVGNKNQLK